MKIGQGMYELERFLRQKEERKKELDMSCVHRTRLIQPFIFSCLIALNLCVPYMKLEARLDSCDQSCEQHMSFAEVVF